MEIIDISLTSVDKCYCVILGAKEGEVFVTVWTYYDTNSDYLSTEIVSIEDEDNKEIQLSEEEKEKIIESVSIKRRNYE